MSGLAPISTPTGTGVITINALSNDIIAEIFPHFTTAGDFSAFSKTCKRMYAISCTIPMYAIPSLSLRQFVFTHNTESKGATIKLIEAMNMDFLDLSPFVGMSLDRYDPSPELKNAEEIFYATVKKSASQANTKINCSKLINSFSIACTKLKIIFQEKRQQEHPFLSHILNSVLLSIYESLLTEVTDIITNHLDVSLTLHSFKAIARNLKERFPNINEVDIEASLRKSLRTKYGADFQQYATESLIAFPTSKIVEEMQQELKPLFHAEKAAIEAELALLRGPIGTIHAAQVEMEAHMDMPDEPIASNNYYTLTARLNALARWEKGTDILIGGKLFEVCNRINEIGSISLVKVRQRGLFFTHLTHPITKENKAALYNSLQQLSNT